jgi:hypothetical protein
LIDLGFLSAHAQLLRGAFGACAEEGSWKVFCDCSQEAPGKLHENKELNSARRKKEAERLNTLVDKLQVRIWVGTTVEDKQQTQMNTLFRSLFID